MSAPPAPALELEHRVKAPPEIVFAYFTDPERHRAWVGTDAVLDPRPGGIYRVEMAPGVAILGEYLLVDPPRRVAYTWGWETTRPLPGGVEEVGPGSTTVEVELTRDGDETILRIRHFGFPRPEFVGMHAMGWGEVIPRLLIAAAGGDPGAYRMPTGR